MKLWTKEVAERFRKIGNQSNVGDPIVVAKFFNPCGSATWYAVGATYVLVKGAEYKEVPANEYDEKKFQAEGWKVEDVLFYGYCSLFGDHNDEWGDFSLNELQTLKLPFGLGIERDLYLDMKPISEICPKAVPWVTEKGESDEAGAGDAVRQAGV